MSYKTILVHVDRSKHAADRIRIAAEIAIAENAHLVGSAMNGISRFLFQDSEFDVSRPVIASQIALLNNQANEALAQFDAIAAQMGVLSYEKRLVDDEPETGIALQARYADLVVVSQPDSDEPGFSMQSDFPEYVMLNSARPVLIVPFAGIFQQIGKNILVAWDGSQEATRAVTNAIPLLRRAAVVNVVVFNPHARPDVHGAQPGADIALYLARQGIKVEVSREITDIDIGNAILSRTADLNSDLIVMGGYGHTRFREVLLGGVTMTMLQSMTVPVLMSH